MTDQPSQPLPRIINLSYAWVGVLPEDEELLVFSIDQPKAFPLDVMIIPDLGDSTSATDP
jgi:hypothetical protein